MAKRKTIKALEEELKESRKLNKTLEENYQRTKKQNDDLRDEFASQRNATNKLLIILQSLKREIFNGGFNLSGIGTDEYLSPEQNESMQHISVSEVQTPSLIKVLKGDF